MENKPLTIAQLHKIIRKYVVKWKQYLFLGAWKIDWNIREYLSGGCEGFQITGRCDSKWQYFIASMDFSYVQMKDMSEEDIEKVVIHEMLHIVLNETREDGIDHEERVTSQLTMIMDWMDKR